MAAEGAGIHDGGGRRSFALGIGGEQRDLQYLVDAWCCCGCRCRFSHPNELVMLCMNIQPGIRLHSRVAVELLGLESEQNHSFSSTAAVAGGGRGMAWANGPVEQIPGQPATSGFFDVLGMRPIAGRTFIAGDGTLRYPRSGDQRTPVEVEIRRGPETGGKDSAA